MFWRVIFHEAQKARIERQHAPVISHVLSQPCRSSRCTRFLSMFRELWETNREINVVGSTTENRVLTEAIVFELNYAERFKLN
jgi:hypothetical protein